MYLNILLAVLIKLFIFINSINNINGGSQITSSQTENSSTNQEMLDDRSIQDESDKNSSHQKKVGLFSKIKSIYNALKPILLSHHPLCESFQDGKHTMILFGKKWCIGCYVTYPIALIVYLIGQFSGLFSHLLTGELWLIGLCCCGVYIFSILGLTKLKALKIISKAIIGVGIAFCVAGIWSQPYNFWIKLVLVMFFFQAGHFFINTMRGWSMYKTCNKCEYKGEWKICPGMASVMNPAQSSND